MINYIKVKKYTLTPNAVELGLVVSEMLVERKFRITIGDIVLIDHCSTSNNQYNPSLVTAFWAACLVELHDFIHGEKNGKIDWHAKETVKLKSCFSILSLIFKLYLLYILIF